MEFLFSEGGKRKCLCRIIQFYWINKALIHWWMHFMLLLLLKSIQCFLRGVLNWIYLSTILIVWLWHIKWLKKWFCEMKLLTPLQKVHNNEPWKKKKKDLSIFVLRPRHNASLTAPKKRKILQKFIKISANYKAK